MDCLGDCVRVRDRQAPLKLRDAGPETPMVKRARSRRASRSGALWAVQAVDQVTQPGGGLKAKVVMKQRLVARELADRLRLVALG